MALIRYIESERDNGAMTTWYIVKGDKGATQFMLMYIKSLDLYLPLDLGIHSLIPLYDEHESLGCAVLNDLCYPQHSYHGAEDLFTRLKASDNDPETIWIELEALYESTF